MDAVEFPSGEGNDTDDSWLSASEGEQEAWLRSALHECVTQPLVVDPRYEIPLDSDTALELSDRATPKPPDTIKNPFTDDDDNVGDDDDDGLVTDVSPVRRPGPGSSSPAQAFPVSASMPNFDFKRVLADERALKLEAIVGNAGKSNSFPRRRSSGHLVKSRQSTKRRVPGFMRDTEAWAKRRSSASSSAAPTRARPAPTPLSRSVCALPTSAAAKSRRPAVKRGPAPAPVLFRKKPTSTKPTTQRRRKPLVRTKDRPPIGKVLGDVSNSVMFAAGTFSRWSKASVTSSSTESIQAAAASGTRARVRRPMAQRPTEEPGRTQAWLPVDEFAPSPSERGSSSDGRDDSEGFEDEDMCRIGSHDDYDSNSEKRIADLEALVRHLQVTVEQMKGDKHDVPSVRFADLPKPISKPRPDPKTAQARLHRKEAEGLRRRLVVGSGYQRHGR
ncbi:Uncharacterized protein PBTT_00314 [Plasmodiophora brassicae]|uniref:Uncharacterized protein n=1 Tax=Plasmodiophora brassicae TaxID=37360 RepID=A0A3P3Y0A8_PLABS|nr:unnamed protein product [Plasmodiophora brassicae]